MKARKTPGRRARKTAKAPKKSTQRTALQARIARLSPEYRAAASEWYKDLFGG